MNTQPVEKRNITSDGETIDIVDIFPTIQGEGPYAGERAIFIRLAGCNLQCPGCDTDYTTERRTMSTERLARTIPYLAKPPYLVVITGGEPFRQNADGLANALLAIGYKVQIETNGTYPPSKTLNPNITIVCSPKTGSVHPAMLERADCFKYVLNAGSVSTEDGLPILALGHSAKPYVSRPPVGRSMPVYLQPMDENNDALNKANIRAVTDSCLRYGYILQLQIHKIVGVQ